MSKVTISEIAASIKASPELVSLAEKFETQKIADAINATTTRVISTVLTTQQLVEAYPDGPLAAETLLLKIEAARDSLLASSNEQAKTLGSLLRRQLQFMNNQGADFGGEALRLVFDQMAARNALTAQEVAALKSFAKKDLVTHTQIGEALKSILEEQNVRT